ncbi:MAG: DUF3742 family protein [Pseudomonas sp.]
MTVRQTNTSCASRAERFGREAARAVKCLKRVEISMLRSPKLAGVSTKYRKAWLLVCKLALLLLVGSLAVSLALGMLAVFVITALPITVSDSDDEPDVFEVGHPRHRFKYPEMYDEHGSLR